MASKVARFTQSAAFPPNYEFVKMRCESREREVGKARHVKVRVPFGKSRSAWQLPRKFGGARIMNGGGGPGGVAVGKNAMLDLRSGRVIVQHTVCRHPTTGRVLLRNQRPVGGLGGMSRRRRGRRGAR